MLMDSGTTEQLRTEIKLLRQQVAELTGIEQRCRQAEAALKACEERNRLLGDSAPLGIFTTDPQGTITGITRKMLELHHWPLVENPESITQSDFMTMVSPEILAADIQALHRSKGNRSPPNIRTPVPRRDCTHLRYISAPYLNRMVPSAA